MKPFYSIISVVIRPEIGEKLSCGLLLVTDSDTYFHFSNNKLNIIKKLVGNNSYKLISDSLKHIKRSVEKDNQSKKDNKLAFNEITKNIFTENYLNYLSNYNNNILSFEKTKILDIEGNYDIYKKLFSMLIDEETFEEKIYQLQEKSNIERVRETYFIKVAKYFNVKREITAKEFPALIMPVKIDLVGRNERAVFTQIINLEKQISNIKSNLANLSFIHDALPDSKQFVIAAEPGKKPELNHRIWNNIRRSNYLDYVDISEVNRITEYAEKNGVLPLFDD